MQNQKYKRVVEASLALFQALENSHQQSSSKGKLLEDERNLTTPSLELDQPCFVSVSKINDKFQSLQIASGDDYNKQALSAAGSNKRKSIIEVVSAFSKLVIRE